MPKPKTKKLRSDVSNSVSSSLYNGEVEITFKPEGRPRYVVADQGKILKPSPPSVTTITAIADFGKSPALQAWAVRMAMEVLRQRIKPDEIHGAQYLEEAYLDAQTNYRKVTKAAADAGTLAHAALERHFTDPDAPPPLPDTPIRAIFDKAIGWYNKKKIQTIGNELRVYSRKHNYVGTLDHAVKINDVCSLIDFKASKHVYPVYVAQIAAYIKAYEEEHPETIFEEAWILQLHEDQTIPYKIGRDQIDAGFEAFVALRNVYEWERRLGKLVPEPEDWFVE